ncbi:MAG: hypothetical protein K0S97_2719 [Chloroflexota bacterium]|nr:hypothetical protein [Chloroflexota bacterium]
MRTGHDLDGGAIASLATSFGYAGRCFTPGNPRRLLMSDATYVDATAM